MKHGQQSGYSPPGTTSNGIRELDELPLEFEAVGEPCRERLHTEPLGRVVTGGDEGDAELACEVEARLFRLARQEQVVALGRSLRQVAAAAARDDRHALDEVRSLSEHE